MPGQKSEKIIFIYFHNLSRLFHFGYLFSKLNTEYRCSQEEMHLNAGNFQNVAHMHLKATSQTELVATNIDHECFACSICKQSHV